MNNTAISEQQTLKERVVSFLWQHTLLLVSIFIMTLGVALTVRSQLGSSVISSIPMAMSLAGAVGKAPSLTIGDYTNIMNFILVGIQILILRRKFDKFQLFQLVIGTVFGWLLDLSMFLTSSLVTEDILGLAGIQLAGSIVLGLGVAMEIRCGSVTMPGEGVPAAISKLTGIPFAKAKIGVDISLVIIAVITGYLFFGRWLWNVVGPGTLFAMIFVGIFVKMFDRHLGWFSRLLDYRPGFRRYLFGLARYLRRQGNINKS